MSLVNRYNFLRWDDGLTPTSVEADLPNGYVRNPSNCDYKPLFISSEAMRFFINTTNGLSFIPLSSDTHKLRLMKANGTLQNADIAPLQTFAFVNSVGDDVNTYYAEVVIDGTVPAGDYYYDIKDISTIRLTSNKFTVLPSSVDYKTYSVLAKFRHGRYFYGVQYQDLAGFYQQFRVHLNQIDLQFEGDKEIYNEVTTGKQRTFNNYMKELRKVESYFFDNLAHEAAVVMFDSDEVYLNLKRYTPKAAYKVNTAITNKLSKGEVDLYVEEFASANRCVTGS